MKTVVWIDEDIDSWPVVRDTLDEIGVTVHTAYNVVQGALLLQRISEGEINCVLLDAIVPWGIADVDPGVFEFFFGFHPDELADKGIFYPGLSLLQVEALRWIRDRTLVFSIARPESLKEAGLPSGVHILSKYDFGSSESKELKEKVEEKCNPGGMARKRKND